MKSPLRNLSLTQRVLGAFGVTTILFLCNTLYVDLVLVELDAAAADEARTEKAAQIAYLLDIQVLRNINLLDSYISVLDNKHIGERILQGRKAAAALRRELRSLTRLPAVTLALDEFEALLPARTAVADRIMAAVDSNDLLEVLDKLRKERDELDARARKQLVHILDEEGRALERALLSDQQLRSRVRWQVTLVSLANLAVVLLVAFLLTRNLQRRLRPLVEETQRLGRGDYAARVPVTGSDELDQVGESFNAMAAQLGELDTVKDEFLALASHQLRAPATGVKGNIGMLLEGYCGELSAEQLEVLNDAWQSNERQLAVIDDMLTVARLEAGRMVLNKSGTDLSKLIQSVVAEQRTVIAQRQQTIAVQLPAAPPMLEVDEQRLRMVFENLLSNASKYTPAGRSIEISLREDADFAQLAVKDAGVGIAPEDLPRLYKKFSRIDNPLSLSVSGTGLGLYLAYEIVRLHGGTITAQSELGLGTTFTDQLPKRSGT